MAARKRAVTVSAAGSVPVIPGWQNAVKLTVDGSPAVIETEDNGRPKTLGKIDGIDFMARGTVRAVRDTAELTITAVKVTGRLHCETHVKGTDVYIVSIAQADPGDTELPQGYQFPQTDGYADIAATIEGTEYTVRWTWHVAYLAYWGKVTLDNKRAFQSLFKSWSADKDGNLVPVMSVIDQTARKIQLQVKDDYKTAGIDITGGKVTLQAEKVEIKNGDKTAALFADGKLNADLVKVRHLYATSQAGATVGHFGDGIAAGNVPYPLWLGADKPDGAPYRVAENGHLYASDADISGKITATSGEIGGFKIYGGDNSGTSTLDYLEWDKKISAYGTTLANFTARIGYNSSNFVCQPGVVSVWNKTSSAVGSPLGVVSVNNSLGGAAFYGSTADSEGARNYPPATGKFAAFLDGDVQFCGHNFTRSDLGNVREGLTGAYRIDDSDTWLVFVNGLFVRITNARESHPGNDW